MSTWEKRNHSCIVPDKKQSWLYQKIDTSYYNIYLTPKTHTQSLFDHPKNFLAFIALPMWKDDEDENDDYEKWKKQCLFIYVKHLFVYYICAGYM